MRLVEGKKNPKIQEILKPLEDKIEQKIKEHQVLEQDILDLIKKWSIITDTERKLHGEEWFISDETKRSKWERELMPKFLRI